MLTKLDFFLWDQHSITGEKELLYIWWGFHHGLLNMSMGLKIFEAEYEIQNQ